MRQMRPMCPLSSSSMVGTRVSCSQPWQCDSWRQNNLSPNSGRTEKGSRRIVAANIAVDRHCRSPRRCRAYIACTAVGAVRRNVVCLCVTATMARLSQAIALSVSVPCPRRGPYAVAVVVAAVLAAVVHPAVAVFAPYQQFLFLLYH